MEVPNTMNPVPWLRKHLEEGDPDLLRSMLGVFAEQLMAAEARRCATPATARSPPSG